MATSMPRITEEGKKLPILPNFSTPNTTWIRPAKITATKNP